MASSYVRYYLLLEPRVRATTKEVSEKSRHCGHNQCHHKCSIAFRNKLTYQISHGICKSNMTLAAEWFIHDHHCSNLRTSKCYFFQFVPLKLNWNCSCLFVVVVVVVDWKFSLSSQTLAPLPGEVWTSVDWALNIPLDWGNEGRWSGRCSKILLRWFLLLFCF